MRHAIWIGLLAGCTLLNDPAAHMGGVRDAPGTLDVPEVPLDDFCDQLATLFCDSVSRCCTMLPAPADCVRQSTASCDGSFGRGLLRDARTGYDRAAAAAYLARGRELSLTCDVGMIDWVRGLIPTILDGIRAPGSDCTPEDVDGGFDTAALFSCDGPDHACVFGGLDRWTCAARVGEGAGCYLNSDCVDGLYCTGIPGTCQPRSAAGASCDPALDQCAGVCYPDVCLDPTADQIYCYYLIER